MEGSDTVAGERKYLYGLWLSVEWFVFLVTADEMNAFVPGQHWFAKRSLIASKTMHEYLDDH